MTQQLGLPEADCKIVTSSLNLSRIFDETTKLYAKPKEVVHWIVGDLLSTAGGAGIGDDDIAIDCAKLATIIRLVDDQSINRAVGKKLLIKIFEEDIDPEEYVREHAMGMVSDTGLIETAIREVLAENEKTLQEYRNGKDKAFGFFVGQVMKRLAGKADPRSVNELLKKALDS